MTEEQAAAVVSEKSRVTLGLVITLVALGVAAVGGIISVAERLARVETRQSEKLPSIDGKLDEIAIKLESVIQIAPRVSRNEAEITEVKAQLRDFMAEVKAEFRGLRSK